MGSVSPFGQKVSFRGCIPHASLLTLVSLAALLCPAQGSTRVLGLVLTVAPQEVHATYPPHVIRLLCVLCISYGIVASPSSCSSIAFSSLATQSSHAWPLVWVFSFRLRLLLASCCCKAFFLLEIEPVGSFESFAVCVCCCCCCCSCCCCDEALFGWSQVVGGASVFGCAAICCSSNLMNSSSSECSS